MAVHEDGLRPLHVRRLREHDGVARCLDEFGVAASFGETIADELRSPANILLEGRITAHARNAEQVLQLLDEAIGVLIEIFVDGVHAGNS